jgi:hypothetical protein
MVCYRTVQQHSGSRAMSQRSCSRSKASSWRVYFKDLEPDPIPTWRLPDELTLWQLQRRRKKARGNGFAIFGVWTNPNPALA